MAEAIDVARLGRQLRNKRLHEGLSLRELAELTDLKIPTLSRIERGDCKDIESSTLLAVCQWLAVDPKNLRQEKPKAISHAGKVVEHTPDILDVYLRADKNLDQYTAQHLSEMFRAAYRIALTTAKKRSRE